MIDSDAGASRSLEDLPELARFFLRRYNIKFRKNVQGIAESTLDILSSYWWPENIRGSRTSSSAWSPSRTRTGSPTRICPTSCVAKLDTQDQAATDNLLERRALDLRAQLHRARGEVVMERDGHVASARHSAEHSQIQDGQTGDPPARTPDQSN